VNRTAPVIEQETPFRMIRTTNVKDGRIDLSICRYVDEPTYERWTRRAQLLDGDVILTREAPIGEVGYIQNLGPVFLGQRLMQYRPDPKKVVPRYLYYAFRSPDLQHQFGTHDGSGSVVSHIRVADCHEFKVSVPPIDHQQNVVTLLGSLDDKIELNRRMNETLEAMAQAIFRDWFVDFGPTRRKLEGATDPITIMGGLVQDTERAQALADLFPAALGDDGLPEGWTERAFGAFVEIIGGGTPKTSNESYWNGSIPWFSVTDTPPKGSIFVDVTEKTISEEGLANSSARLVRAGTTIISARGTVGNLALTPHEMTFNQSCYGLQGNAAVGDCFVFLAAQNIVERLKGMAHGSVFSTITRSTFDNIQLAYTPDEIFQAFESLARPMFDKVLGNVKESRTLAATRDLLLPKLMSGEIRLQSAEKPIEVRV
jgi:type I restriction enzyme S subunit